MKKCEIPTKKSSKVTPSIVKLNKIAKILKETFKHQSFRNDLQKKAVLSICKGNIFVISCTVTVNKLGSLVLLTT